MKQKIIVITLASLTSFALSSVFFFCHGWEEVQWISKLADIWFSGILALLIITLLIFFVYYVLIPQSTWNDREKIIVLTSDGFKFICVTLITASAVFHALNGMYTSKGYERLTTCHESYDTYDPDTLIMDEGW